MKKIFFMLFIFLFVFTSCRQGTNKKNVYTGLEVACANVIDMELKGLERYPDALNFFSLYKRKKIDLVFKAFNNIDYSEDIKYLKDITTTFNRLSLDDESFSYVERGIETNPYIELFNSALLREVIMSAKEDEIIELEKLKCIYLF